VRRGLLGTATAAARFFLREAATNLLRSRGINTLTVGIITASLFILGGFVLLVSNLGSAVEEWNRVAIIVYLVDDAPGAEVDGLRGGLAAEAIVREVRYISREEAAAIFKQRFAHLAGATEDLEVNPFPASIEILARGDRSERSEETSRLIETLRGNALVEEVRDNEAESRKVMALIQVVSVGGWVIGGILAMASLFTIFNVIRLTVYQRRDDISIMRLVGATATFIRGPFLLEGTLQGIIGAGSALVLLFGAWWWLEAYAAATENPFLQLLTSGFLTAPQAGLLAGAGTLLGAAGSFLSLRRFLSG
jgi:cell division transport system permease protein